VGGGEGVGAGPPDGGGDTVVDEAVEELDATLDDLAAGADAVTL
jgi:hypothetical protein